MDPIMLQAALRYASAGYPVLPMRPGQKAPLIKGGAHAASTNPDRIRGWWRRWPRADVALACGERAGFDALDVDRQHDGNVALVRLLDRYGDELPETSRQLTPSGGFHLLFRHRPGLKNRSGGQGDVPPGLDCRTTGAQIRTAPTAGYRWQQIMSLEALPPWPEWLARLYLEREVSPPVDDGPAYSRSSSPEQLGQAESYLARALDGIGKDIAAASPGAQQATLNGGAFRAGRLLAALPVITTDDVVDDLVKAGLAMANETGRPPWRLAEVERTVRRAINDGLKHGPADVPVFEARPRARNSTAHRSKVTDGAS